MYNLIDKGGYGCVINPPVSLNYQIIRTIKEYNDKNKSDIAKIFQVNKKRSFYEELNIAKKIESIDKKFKFTVKVKGAHKIKSNVFDNYYDIDYCLRKKKGIYHSKPDEYYQIIMENGGYAIDTLPYQYIEYRKFMKLFQIFLKGMIDFQKLNYVHNDIKSDNILLKTNKISLIDFSLLVNSMDVFSHKNIHSLSRYDYYYAPEYYIYYCILKNNRFDKDYILYSFMQNDIFTKNEKYDFNNNFKSQIVDFLKTIEKSINGGKTINDIFDKNIAMKSDIFSLSYVLYDLFEKEIIIFENTNQLNFFKKIITLIRDGNPYHRVSFSDLYKIVSKNMKL